MQVTTIIHEGCTEEIYIKHLLSLLKINNTTTLDFHNVCGGGPVKLLEKFQTLISDTQREHIKNYIFIMDSDKPQHDAIRNKLLLYKDNYQHFDVISYDPCIEMFLIAHFEDNIPTLRSQALSKTLCTPAMLLVTNTKPKNIKSPCKQSAKYLKYHYIPGYDKASCSNKFQNLINQPEVARAHKQCNSLKVLISFIKKIA
jgi:hypothetical protein